MAPILLGVVTVSNALVAGAGGLILDIYARVSRVGDDRQRSTGGQVGDCRVRVAEHGATVGEVFVDQGRSAWNPRVRRKAWESLMERLESGATGGVVVFDMARFSRRPIEGERLILAAEKGLVILDSEGEYDLSTANGRKTFRDQLNAAAYESDRLSTRVKRGKRLKAIGGETNHTHRPFGYERDGVTVRESEAVVLREMVTRLLAGESLRKIAIDLNGRGITTTVKAKWSGDKVKRVALNPRNGGYVAHLGEIVARAPGTPLIGETDWERLTALFTARGKGRPASAEYVCSGLVHCGHCGRGLTGRPNPNRGSYPDGGVRRRYWCQKRVTGGGCNKVSVDMRILDTALGSLVVTILSDPRHAEAVNTAAVAAAEKRRPIADDLATAEELATQLSGRLGRGEISLERYDAAVEPLDRRIAELRGKLDALDAVHAVDDSQEAVAESVEVWTARWDAANVAEKRALIKRALRGKRVKIMPATVRGPVFDRDRVVVEDRTATA
ncbi:recombinase family protein [Nocardia stercoris]|uniref:Recombinase family protein n=1 Tax=Nocardia stercoris TaxID=2483361 RepID=A0A3M2KUZ1_9NOCA|nr:recombinase family protein [Nocardia stercoris]RMI28971.1 recombinase family protein [Nocardia stercoris]